MSALDLSLIEDARLLIKHQVFRTPLLESYLLNQELGGRVLLKAENLQRTGSFKFRGAYTKLSRLPEEQIKNGVVAYSSGNHAQGVAMAARLLGCPATIVMPANAPQIKIANTRSLGAEVKLYDPKIETREEIGQAIAEDKNMVLIKPYDDWDVMSGQGTLGLEILDQTDALGTGMDHLVSPCGGGGLIAGVSVAIHSRYPDAEIFIAEPKDFDDAIRSLSLGERVANENLGQASICDAIITPMPGELTFQIHQAHLSGGFAVDDSAVKRAMRTAFDYFKLVLEPGGAIALAAVLDNRIGLKDKTTVVICSGGNVDKELFVKALQG